MTQTEQQKPLNERLAIAESQIVQHEGRLNRHDERISDLQQQNTKQDATLNKLCQKLDKNSELTKKNQEMISEIHTQGKTTVKLVKAIVYGIPAIVGLWMALKQIGLM